MQPNHVSQLLHVPRDVHSVLLENNGARFPKSDTMLSPLFVSYDSALWRHTIPRILLC